MAKNLIKSPADNMAPKKPSPGKYDGKGDGVWSKYPRTKSGNGAPEKFYDTVGPFGQFNKS